jgi:hypothetical protein
VTAELLLTWSEMSQTQRTFEISDVERKAAKQALYSFKKFMEKLWAARQADKRLVDVLEKNREADTTQLFEIRHLLRKFQKEVKDRYTDLVFMFAGKKDNGGNTLSEGVIHSLDPLEKDTVTRQIKTTLQDAMQDLTEFIEEFLEGFENFNDKDQIKQILDASKKADQLTQSIEVIIDKQLRPHFERNIMKRNRMAAAVQRIHRRARLIEMLVSK